MTHKLFKPINRKWHAVAAVAATATVMIAQPAFAQGASTGLATSLTSISSNIGSIPDLLTAMAYILGVFLLIKALLAGMELAKEPGADKVRGMIVPLVVGVLLLFLPYVIRYVQGTLFGADTMASGTLQRVDAQPATF